MTAMILLRLASVLLAIAGIVAMVFGYAIRDAAFGHTAVISGTIGFGGGVILFALTQTVRELRRIGELLDFQSLAIPARPSLAAMAAATGGDGHAAARGEVRPIDVARNARPPRETAPRKDPTTLPFDADRDPRPDARREARRNANHLAAPEFEPPRAATPDDDAPAHDNDRDADATWPSTVVMPRLNDLRRARAARAAALAAEQSATVVTSGHVNDMSYSLYSDGSIVATTPAGVMRFSTLAEMSEYLNALAPSDRANSDPTSSDHALPDLASPDSATPDFASPDYASPGAIARAESAAAMSRHAPPRAGAV